MPPAEKPGMVEAVGAALNPMQGNGPLQKWGPLLVLIAWLALGAALMFDVIPNPDFAQAVWGVIGLPVGAWLRHLGS